MIWPDEEEPAGCGGDMMNTRTQGNTCTGTRKQYVCFINTPSQTNNARNDHIKLL